MLLFMATDICQLLKNIMQRFPKKNILHEADQMFKASKIEVEKKDNLMPAIQVDIRFAAKAELKAAEEIKSVSAKQVLEFQVQAQRFMTALTAKVLDKCPLKYSLFCSLVCLQPPLMLNDPEKAASKFETVLKKLAETRWRSHQDILTQFKNFLSEVSSKHQEVFKNWTEDEPLDKFFYLLLAGQANWKKLWSVIQMLLMLSHSQASVERGFSINKHIIDLNLQEMSLVTQRLVYDTVKSTGITVEDFPITPKLGKSCASAHKKYTMYLEEKKKEEAKATKEKKAITGNSSGSQEKETKAGGKS